MNDHKLNQLFELARHDRPMAPSDAFANRVLRAIRREPPVAAAESGSLFDPVIPWFPRLVATAVGVVALCVAVDLGLGAFGVPSLSEGFSAISEQWLFAIQ